MTNAAPDRGRRSSSNSRRRSASRDRLWNLSSLRKWHRGWSTGTSTGNGRCYYRSGPTRNECGSA